MLVQAKNKMLVRAATVVQVLQDLFTLYCVFYFTCDRSLTPISFAAPGGDESGGVVEEFHRDIPTWTSVDGPVSITPARHPSPGRQVRRQDPTNTCPWDSPRLHRETQIPTEHNNPTADAIQSPLSTPYAGVRIKCELKFEVVFAFYTLQRINCKIKNAKF